MILGYMQVYQVKLVSGHEHIHDRLKMDKRNITFRRRDEPITLTLICHLNEFVAWNEALQWFGEETGVRWTNK